MTPGTSIPSANTSCAGPPGQTGPDGRALEPLPYLLIIVDEFGELLSGRPDFVDLFVQIGRVGRSLGMHLLLATQRLEEGKLRGLDSNLSYRICLRTFSAAESRTVIGTADAYRLPPIPGSAYLKVADSEPERFRVAHVSGPHLSAAQRSAQTASPARGNRPVPVAGARRRGGERRGRTRRAAEAAADGAVRDARSGGPAVQLRAGRAPGVAAAAARCASA